MLLQMKQGFEPASYLLAKTCLWALPSCKIMLKEKYSLKLPLGDVSWCPMDNQLRHSLFLFKAFLLSFLPQLLLPLLTGNLFLLLQLLILSLIRLLGVPIRIPNHPAPKRQFTISWFFNYPLFFHSLKKKPAMIWKRIWGSTKRLLI